MDIAAIAKNPWVWGIGVVLGVLVLASRSAGSGDAGANGWNPNTILGLNEIAANNNAAMAGFSAAMASIAASRSKDNNATNLARDLKVIDAIENMNGTFSTVAVAMNESAAGVTKARIQQATDLALDRSANETRREMTYAAADVSKFQTQLAASVQMDQTAKSLKATTQANAINGGNTMWQNIFDFGKFLAGTFLPLVF